MSIHHSSDLTESVKFIKRYVFPLILAATLLAFFARHGLASEGQIAPAFTLPPIKAIANGQEQISLEDYKGKVVYLDFWASWCGPCRYEMPMLNALRNEFKGQPFEVIGINVDAEPSDALNFLARYPVDFPTVSDPIGKTSRLYRLTGFPSGFLISQEGIIIETTQGFQKGYIDHLRNQVKAQLD